MNCNPIREREDWFISDRKPTICPRCGKKQVRKAVLGYPTAEATHSGKWAIMGCTLEMPSAKEAYVECDYKINYPPD